MMGFYPVVPADLNYAVTSPVFDKITIQLDSNFYSNEKLVIEKKKSAKSGNYIKSIQVDGVKVKGKFLNHNDLVKAKSIVFEY